MVDRRSRGPLAGVLACLVAKPHGRRLQLHRRGRRLRGNLDITQASDFVTVSWTKFHYSTARADLPSGSDSTGAEGHRFSNLIGAADNNPIDVGHLNGDLYTGAAAAGASIGTAFAPPYAYTAEAASAVQADVQANAGPQ